LIVALHKSAANLRPDAQNLEERPGAGRAVDLLGGALSGQVENRGIEQSSRLAG
jgi:hypothetical protein